MLLVGTCSTSQTIGGSMIERILRRPDVQARTGLSRSGLYSAIKNGEFPAPVKLTDRAVGWLESSISQWIESRTSMKGGASCKK